MRNKYLAVVMLTFAGMLAVLMAACSQSTSQQMITFDAASALPPETALAYLAKYPGLSATSEGVLCRKYENFIQGISTDTRFIRFEELYVYTASTKMFGNEQPRECLLIGARPYKNDAFMVGSHRNMREFFNLDRFVQNVWFRHFAIYECSDDGEGIDQKAAAAFLSLGAKILDESTLENR